MYRRGFTLIELLVTIGILVILAAMVMFATRSVTGTAKTHATHATLQNCMALLSEYDTVKLLSGDTDRSWIWWNGTAIQSFNAPTNGFFFWTKPYIDTTVIPNILQSLDAPGYVKNDSLGVEQRNGSRAVLNTMAAMGALAAVTSNRESLLKLPQDQVFIPDWESATTLPKITDSGPDRVLGTTDDTTNPIWYPVGCRVRDPNNSKIYLCILNHQATSTAPNSDATNWQPDSVPIPMIRDGWGDPIILVPATGLQVRLLNGKSAYDPTDKSQTWIIVSPEGRVNNNGSSTVAPTVVTPGRPFWASAGPDGDFSKGDDNIYSFEQ